MRTLSTLLGTAALFMGLAGCISTDPDDILTTVTSATLSATDTNSSMGTETGSGDGDGDPATGDGDGEASGDGDGDGPTGCFNCPCGPNGECDEDLECNPDTMMCELGGGDGDGDPTTTTTGGAMNESWDPAECDPMSVIGIMGIDGNFCTNICTGQGNEAAECAVPPAGTQAGCVLSDGMGTMFCALICDPMNDTCPMGSSCKDLMDPMNPGLGLCTYP